MANCTVDSFVAAWGFRTFIANCIIVLCGATGSIVSLWSLFQCRNTNLASKILLGTFFGVQLGVCLVTVPGFSFIKKLHTLCRAGELPMQIKFFILVTHLVLLPIERMNFTAMAISRLVAVRWPHYYKKLTQVKVVVIMEIIIVLYALSPGLLAFSIMIRKKQLIGVRRDATATTMDNIAYTIRLFILINLLLDVPHTLDHLLRFNQVPSFIIHSIFYMHLAIDPFIFVGMNLHYRQALLKSLRSCFQWKSHQEPGAIEGQELPVRPQSVVSDT